MLPRIREVKALDEYVLDVLFDDGREVLYDVKDDIQTIESYRVLEEVSGLFEQVKLDKSRTCVSWNDEVDLPSDIIYEYAREKRNI